MASKWSGRQYILSKCPLENLGEAERNSSKNFIVTNEWHFFIYRFPVFPFSFKFIFINFVINGSPICVQELNLKLHQDQDLPPQLPIFKEWNVECCDLQNVCTNKLFRRPFALYVNPKTSIEVSVGSQQNYIYEIVQFATCFWGIFLAFYFGNGGLVWTCKSTSKTHVSLANIFLLNMRKCFKKCLVVATEIENSKINKNNKYYKIL